MKFTSSLAALAALSLLSQTSLAAPTPLESTALLARRSDTTQAYLEMQRKMYIAEMKAQAKMAAETTEREHAHKINGPAYRPVHNAASDKIQRRSETQAYLVAQRKMYQAEMKAQAKMAQQTTEHEHAQKMNDAAWKTASSAASDKIQ
jgi:hypothetical protein